MLKIYMAIATLLLLVGCGVEKNPSIKSAMFQTVSSKDATLVQSGAGKSDCVRCGMNLVRYYKTGHSAQKDNKHYQYCSIHCLEEHLGKGVTLKNPKVVDVSSLKLIGVGDAYYVVGSKKRGTMTKVSKYAFKEKKMAEKFKAKYGGEIMDFNGALKKAKEDFRY